MAVSRLLFPFMTPSVLLMEIGDSAAERRRISLADAFVHHPAVSCLVSFLLAGLPSLEQR